MSIDLPTFPGPQSAEPVFLDAGGVQHSLAGGEDMRIDRLGDRFGLSVTMPPMRWSTYQGVAAARIWSVRLLQGLSQGVVFPFPQPNFTPPGNPSTVAVAAVSAASQVSVQNNGPAVTLLEGQFVSHIRAATGRRYLYQVRADTVLPANGAAIVPLWPRIRGPMAVGDVLDFKTPRIEGLVTGDKSSWSLEATRLVGVQFMVQERG